jgi:hypothetical protein
MTNSPAHVSRYRRPLHPPFTHFPIAAYVLAAGLDVISVIGGSGHAWASELWHAGTFVLIAGLALCLMTMLSGSADLIRFEERQPAAVDHGGPCLRDGRGGRWCKHVVPRCDEVHRGLMMASGISQSRSSVASTSPSISMDPIVIGSTTS